MRNVDFTHLVLSKGKPHTSQCSQPTPVIPDAVKHPRAGRQNHPRPSQRPKSVLRTFVPSQRTHVQRGRADAVESKDPLGHRRNRSVQLHGRGTLTNRFLAMGTLRRRCPKHHNRNCLNPAQKSRGREARIIRASRSRCQRSSTAPRGTEARAGSLAFGFRFGPRLFDAQAVVVRDQCAGLARHAGFPKGRDHRCGHRRRSIRSRHA